MKQNSFYEIMTAAQFFADAAATLSEAVAYANSYIQEKKENFSCSKFHLCLAIAKVDCAEFYLNTFLNNENLKRCDLVDIPHTNEELI